MPIVVFLIKLSAFNFSLRLLTLDGSLQQIFRNPGTAFKLLNSFDVIYHFPWETCLFHPLIDLTMRKWPTFSFAQFHPIISSYGILFSCHVL